MPNTHNKKKDLDRVVQLMRKLSARVADLAFKMGVSPNQITIFRFIVLGGGAAICLFLGSYSLNIIALGLLILGFFLDLVDGDLARRHNLKSRLGAALEENLDAILFSMLILAISLNLLYNSSYLAPLGYLCLFSQIFSKHYTDLYKQRFGIDCVESNPELENVRSRSDKFTYLIAELLAPRNTFLSLFSNFRYYLIMGIITNQLPLFFSIYTIMISLRWVILALFTISYEHTEPSRELGSIYGTLSKLDLKRRQEVNS